ncbi:CocE/NonD family hydrolase [Aliigemmobacter aestuarii]|uniref:CocE/NonD family hydrolase n=1 Tax=Aliigemmobacter aestuarii TaxID=1445661 RepID=A0A4S3MT06_9RHOB|nr:CocE/NonD family hydrolase [Gemmobacter aestuarii]THD85617.1 CocE/NonD family hydrolase [Gemmobacter aestuarii]
MTTVRTQFPHPVEVVENLFIPLPDGTRLAAKLWRPAGADPVPAILEYLPYRKHDGTRTRDQGLHMYLAGHGYACLRVDIRGTGESEGVIVDEYTPVEQKDGSDVIAWIAAQDWCDGQVAMIGISWGGFNGLQIAARQPPALKTVIAVGFTDDRYATDVHYIGGCLSKDNIDWSGTMMASQDLPPDPAIHGPAWRDIWMDRIRANRPWGLTWLAHQRRDGYWRQGSVCEVFAAIRVPVYAVSGWADNYSEAVPRLLAGLSSPCRGLIGPWAHSFPHDVTVEPAIGWLQEVIRWCDHWMKGRDTGIMDEPALRVWMQDSVPPATCYRHRPGRWVGEDAWPSPRIRWEALHPVGGRLAAAPQAGLARVRSPLWVGLAAGEIGRYGDEADWPTDQREDDAGSLVWQSEPLPDRVEILGAPRLTLRVASDRPLALAAVRLNDVAPDGSSTRVTLGLLNLTHHKGHDRPEPLTPGEFITVVVELDDIAHAFPAGHRIGLSLSSTYWPIAWPSPELTMLTVDCGQTRLDVPVRPPRAADAALRAFDPPEHAPQSPVTDHPVTPGHPRRVTRDLLTGRITVDFPRWTYDHTMTDIGIRQASEGFARYEIIDGDPLSACLVTRYRVSQIRADATLGHESETRLSCDATHFHLSAWLRITENGHEVFRRAWNEAIQRDHI